jgi:hypothetical protein
MELKPFFTYFGGKYRIAKKYPQPVFETIIEPFAGSAGYSLRFPNKKIVLCDKDEIIAGLWNYLINVTESEILGLPENITDLRDMKLTQEQKWLIGFWLCKGHERPRPFASSWMQSKLRPNSYWGTSIKFRISNQLKFIRHWKTIHGSYEDLENIEATWFIDPPYIRAGKKYRQNKICYSELGGWSKEREGQVIVCEQYPADWLPFQDVCNAKSINGKPSKEVLWTKPTVI